MQMSSRLKVSH